MLLCCSLCGSRSYTSHPALDPQFPLTMAPKGKQWIVKFFKGDVCHHWKTGRQGVVTAAEEGNSHMWILFDDSWYKELRRKAAFIKGECERLDLQ